MTQHTPGPWTIREAIANAEILSLDPDVRPRPLASVILHPRVGRANARLIAAAPEMLARLTELENWARRALKSGLHAQVSFINEGAKIADAARALLAKIEGKG